MRCRKELERKLYDNISALSINKTYRKKLLDQLRNNYNLDSRISSQYISGMAGFEKASPELMYWFSTSFNNISEKVNREEFAFPHHKIALEHYFSEREIKQYENTKFENEAEAVYPIIIPNLLKVNEDQWVTVVDVNFLSELNDKQIINYNKNTQRNLTVKTINGIDTFHITLKQSSVREIKELLEEGLFISNDISLNLNLDNSEVDFEIKKNTLYLYAGQLDIIDGYHRFRALISAKVANEEFNYKFILNIMNFDESKANTFIAQEDKRNKIKKTYARSLDGTSMTSFIISRLNQDPSSLLFGQIGKYGAKVSQETLTTLIDIYFPTTDRREALEKSKYISKILNTYLENEEQLNFRTLCILFKCASLNSKSEMDIIKKAKQYIDNEKFFTGYKVEKERLTRGLLQELNTIQ